MKIAVISDIHSNLQALEVCIGYIESLDNIDYIAVLGDIVGYGPNPSECISLVKEKAAFSILGNHDSAAAGLSDITYFNYAAKEAVNWTVGKLKSDEINYLRELPYTVSRDDLLFVHSSPGDPEAWLYVLYSDDVTGEFQSFSEKICFIGHSHIPGIYGENGTVPHTDGPVELNSDEDYIINVGSVGQPRDGDPRSSFGIYDGDAGNIEIIRLEYDRDSVRRAIIDSGLPEYLGDRLISGR